MDLNEINALRARGIPPQHNLIDGKSSPTKARIEVVSPIDGQAFTDISASAPQDVDAAVAAARAAFADGRWRTMPPAKRRDVMVRWAALIEAEAMALAVLGVRDNGTEIAMALKAEPASAAQTIRYYAEAIDKVGGEIVPTAEDKLCLVHRQPRGVIAALVPWNFPMMIGAWKIAPALAMGNAVVVKPSETASLTLIRMAELALEAGLPPGVLNIVTGDGQTTGAALAAHMDVDTLVFTGSGQTGRHLLAASAASNMKAVYLELGGKSPNIIFDDAPDLNAAAKAAVGAIFRNSGQTCVAGARLIVAKTVKGEVLGRIVELAEGLKIGDPLDPSNDVGAVHSKVQLDRNLAHIDAAKASAASLALAVTPWRGPDIIWHRPSSITSHRKTPCFAKKSSARS